MNDKETEPEFSINSFGRVEARFKDGGRLQSQTVEAALLYAILQTLENMQAK